MKNLNTYKFAAKVNMANKGISRNGQNKDVYSRTIEIPQFTRIFKANCWFKIELFTVCTMSVRYTLMIPYPMDEHPD